MEKSEFIDEIKPYLDQYAQPLLNHPPPRNPKAFYSALEYVMNGVTRKIPDDLVSRPAWYYYGPPEQNRVEIGDDEVHVSIDIDVSPDPSWVVDPQWVPLLYDADPSESSLTERDSVLEIPGR